MLQFTYATHLYMSLSAVDASQESCLGTVVNMSPLRILLILYKIAWIYITFEKNELNAPPKYNCL